MDIGQRIMQLREEKGWTTNRLANLSGLSQSFLRSVEMGDKGISVENLELLCQTLGISIRSFFDTTEPSTAVDIVLQQQIDRMSQEQKRALSAFLKTMD